ncbi:MAG: YbbR-like domain-containing protein [Candidatus Zixiibacteriota bacterium]
MYLFKNFWLKIIALAIGFLIWFHVITEKEYSYELKLPVSDYVLKKGLTLSKKPPDSLLVSVSATGKQLLRERWRREGVRIDASQFETGRHEIALNNTNTFMMNPAGNVSLENISLPTLIELEIDHQVTNRISVTPDIIATADEGFAVNLPMAVTPPEVNIIGPATLLERFKTVFTELKELSNLKNNVTIKLPLVPPVGYGIKLSPDSVTLALRVIPVKTRVYENLPVVVFNAPYNQKYQLSPPFITVELTGPPGEIDLLNSKALTVSVDYKQLDSLGMIPVKIDCPSNFKVKKASSDSVKFIFK